MIVKIHALFSHNELIGSKIISHGTKHLVKDCPLTSHVALLINNRWVHESTGYTGVRVISYDKWKEINTEVARIELGEIEYQVVADKFREIKAKKYDYLGVIFLGLCIVPTFFGKSLPKENKWESKEKYFCCEVLGFLTGHYYGMSSPVQILDRLKHEQIQKT